MPPQAWVMLGILALMFALLIWNRLPAWLEIQLIQWNERRAVTKVTSSLEMRVAAPVRGEPVREPRVTRLMFPWRYSVSPASQSLRTLSTMRDL